MEIVTLLIHQNIIMVIYMAFVIIFCIKRKLLQKPEAVISEKCCFIL